MRAEVTYFEWPDLEPGGLAAADRMSTVMVFAAGPIGVPSPETFQVTVCTPDGLAALVERDSVVIGRHFLFAAAIQVDQIEEFVRDRLRRLDGDSWTELAEKIARIGYWEFEDYTEYRKR
ncbi:Imm8 family immunity protein [Jatrophihabitans sp. DSM 45814]